MSNPFMTKMLNTIEDAQGDFFLSARPQIVGELITVRKVEGSTRGKEWRTKLPMAKIGATVRSTTKGYSL